MKCLHPVNKLIERPTVADFIIISLRPCVSWSQIEKPPLSVCALCLICKLGPWPCRWLSYRYGAIPDATRVVEYSSHSGYVCPGKASLIRRGFFTEGRFFLTFGVTFCRISKTLCIGKKF